MLLEADFSAGFVQDVLRPSCSGYLGAEAVKQLHFCVVSCEIPFLQVLFKLPFDLYPLVPEGPPWSSVPDFSPHLT